MINCKTYKTLGLSLLFLFWLFSPIAGLADVIPIKSGQRVYMDERAPFLQKEVTEPIDVIVDQYLKTPDLWKPHGDKHSLSLFRYDFLWQKVTLKNTDTTPLNLFLVCTESTLISIETAIVKNGVISESWHTGTQQPFSQRPTKHRQFLFPFQLDPGETATVLVGSPSNGKNDFLWIEEQKSFWLWDNKNLIADSTYFGAIGILSLLALILFLVNRDPTSFWFFAYVLISATHNMCRNGFFDQYIYPGSGGITSPLALVSVGLGFISAIMFIYYFLELNKSSGRIAIYIGKFLIGLNLVVVTSVFLSDIEQHTILVIYSTVLTTVYFFSVWIMSIFNAYHGHRRSQIFAVSATLFMVPLVFSVMYFFFLSLRDPPIWLRSRSGDVLFTIALYITLLYELRKEYVRKQSALLEAEARTQFFATMSHEIRTPLNGVIGMAELLKQTEQSPKQRQYSETIISSGNMLLSLINDILDLTKLSREGVELEQAPYNLDQTLSECVSSFTPQIIKKRIPIHIDIQPGMPYHYIGDHYRIRQIIFNLVSNAMKFTDTGEIIVSAGATPTDLPDRVNLTLSVKDTGVGINPDAREKIFNQFSQGDVSTTRRFGGTGLGLAICKAIVDGLGGSIDVESTPGEGSTFNIQFVATVDVKAESSRQDNRRRLQGKRIIALGSYNAIYQYISKHMDYWGIDFHIAHSLSEAEQLLSTQPFDAIFAFFVKNRIERVEAFRKFGLPLLLFYYGEPEYEIGDWPSKLATIAITSPRYNLAQAINSLFSRQPEISEPLPDDNNAPDFTGVRALVVEDNHTNQLVAAGILRTLGFEIDIADNGKQAIEMFQHQFYPIIFMDCEMPVMDGYEATQRILQLGRNKPPIIIALTAQTLSEATERCMAAGMHHILHKPVTLDHIRNCLKAITLPTP